MSNSFNLNLDTLAPVGVTLLIDGGSLHTANTSAVLAIDCLSVSKVGYTMKVWGSILGAATEEEASWQAYAESGAVTLTPLDGLKTVYLKIRDAVWNESIVVSKFITLDTSIPVVTITGPDVNVISKVVGKNTAIVNFSSDKDFVQYKIGVVQTSGALQSTAVVIPVVDGSINTSGDGVFKKETNITVTIKGTDLQTATGGNDGEFIIKAFVKNEDGTWSV